MKLLSISQIHSSNESAKLSKMCFYKPGSLLMEESSLSNHLCLGLCEFAPQKGLPFCGQRSQALGFCTQGVGVKSRKGIIIYSLLEVENP